MNDVFVSYKREDEDRARVQVDGLRNAGVKVILGHDLGGGENLQSRIRAEVESAHCVIEFWSTGSAITARNFVRDEARRANGRGELLRVRIDDVKLPPEFRQIPTLDLLDWSGDEDDTRVQRVVDSVNRKLHEARTPVLPVAQSKAHPTSKSSLFVALASAPGIWRALMLSLIAVGLGGLSGCGFGGIGGGSSTKRISHAQSRYERVGSADRVIVFVHGIFGDADESWTCATTGVSWPKLIAGDDAFPKSDIYVVAYDSPYWGNRMTIDEIVSNLSNRFEADQVFAHREVLFVAHSMGGLVVQRYLLTHREHAAKVPFIFFYSTPESGAQIAKLANAFSADPLLKQMLPGEQNDYLLNLENEWIASQFAIKRFCAYEKKPMNGIFVVDRLTGTRNCTNQTPIPINEDHSGIVKPCSREDDAYIALRNALTSHQRSASPTFREEVVRRTWKSPSMNIDCNKTHQGQVEAAIPINPQYESVMSVTAAIVDTDNIKALEVAGELPAAAVVPVKFSFRGLDRDFIGNCPGGGHASVLVTFTVRRRVPVAGNGQVSHGAQSPNISGVGGDVKIEYRVAK